MVSSDSISHQSVFLLVGCLVEPMLIAGVTLGTGYVTNGRLESLQAGSGGGEDFGGGAGKIMVMVNGKGVVVVGDSSG